MNSDLNHFTPDQLLPLVISGDEAAYAVFCKKTHELLLLRAVIKLGDQDDAEDVLQDILLWIWINRDQLKEVSNINGYLFVMLNNRIVEVIRKKETRKKREQMYFNSGEQISASIPFEIKELGEELTHAINMLAPASREAFIKAYLHKNSHKEIAAEMGINVQSVRNNIFRALKSLRAQLKKNSL